MDPAHVQIFPNGELGIVWEDGQESYWGGRPLRLACRCALCADEMTGAKLLVEDRVPQDVRPVRAEPVGNYGLSVVFSDGHSTGIYALRWLRENSPAS
jgi:ATP-binding protein involved in chromosome partitioning